jgi:hypothetical protein
VKSAIATDRFAMVHSFKAGILMCIFIWVVVFFLTQALEYRFTLSWAFDVTYLYDELGRP